ncbi:MAG: hypothetical protein H0U73_00095 [Tatlockia sp.]|nr:hypothetical protein [Tatlockia sp.]
MKEKEELIKTEGFTTIQESHLGQVLKQFHTKLISCQEADKKDLSESTLERDYSTKQIAALLQILTNLNTVLEYFSEGKNPDIYNLLIVQPATSLYSASEYIAEFATPEYAIYRKMQSGYILYYSIEKCLSNFKSLNPINVSKFTDLLKAELSKNHFLDEEKTPGFNLKDFYAAIDTAIDEHFNSFYELNFSSQKEGVTIINSSFSAELEEKFFNGKFCIAKYGKSDLKITHQQTYDFVREALELVQSLPKEMHKTLSFFDPAAVTQGWAAKAIAYWKSISFVYNKDSDSYTKTKINRDKEISELEFISMVNTNKAFLGGEELKPGEGVDLTEKYKLFKNKTELKTVEEINLVEKYNSILANIADIYSTSIATYYNNYADTPHVKKIIETEGPKANLMQNFIQKEKELIDQCDTILNNAERLIAIQPHNDNKLNKDGFSQDDIFVEIEIDNADHFDFMQPEELLNFMKTGNYDLDKIRLMEKKLAYLNDALKQFSTIKERVEGYSTTPFNVLIKAHENLAIETHEASTAGLNLNLPLTQTILFRDHEDKFIATPLSKQLAINSLTIKQQEKIEQEVGKLSQLIEAEWENLRQQEINLHETQNSTRINDFNTLVETVNYKTELKLEKSLDLKNPDECIKALRNQLKLLEKLSESLAVIKDRLLKFQIDINQPAKCPDYLEAKYINMNQDADNCYKTSREHAKENLAKVNAFTEKLDFNKTQLEKEIKATKRLSKMMKSANPTAYFEIVKKKESELQDWQLRYDTDLKELNSQTIKVEELNLNALTTDPLKKLEAIKRVMAAEVRQTEALTQVLDRVKTVIEVLTAWDVKALHLFQEDSLTTVKGTIEAMVWLNKQLEYCTKIAITISNADKSSLKNFEEFLIAVNKMIGEAEAGFPFEHLDPMIEEKYQLKKWFGFGTKGFDHLLVLLKTNDNTQARWTNYRSAKLINNKDFENDKELLVGLIGRFCKNIQLEINLCEANDLYQANREDLEKLAYDLKILLSKINELVIDQENLFAIVVKINEEKEKQENQEIEGKRLLDELTKTVETDEKMLTSLVSSIDILSHIANLLSQTQDLAKNISQIELDEIENSTLELLNKNQNSFIELIDQAFSKLTALKLSLGQLSLKMNEPKDDIVQKIQVELEESEAKVKTIVQNICTKKLKDLDSCIGQIDLELKTNGLTLKNFEADKVLFYNQQIQSFIDTTAHFEQTSLAMKCLTNEERVKQPFSGIASEVQKNLNELFASTQLIQENLLSQIEIDLKYEFEKLIAGKFNLAKFPAHNLLILKDSLQHLAPQSKDALALIDKIMKEFLAQSIKAVDQLTVVTSFNYMKINTLPLEESKTSLVENRNASTEVSNYLELLPVESLQHLIACLGLLNPESIKVSEGLAAVIEVSAKLKAQVNTRLDDCAKLEGRISARDELATEFNEKFLNYIVERKSKSPNKAKDFIFSDGDDREKFVNELVIKLNNYAESGNSIEVLSYLNKQIFPGWGLQPIINRLKIAIKELDNDIPKSEEIVQIEIEVDDDARYLQVASILRSMDNRSLAFGQAINELYKKVDLINHFADSLTKDKVDEKNAAIILAITLKKQIDTFIISNKRILCEPHDSVVKKNLLFNFQSDFICQASTCNDLLSKESSWPTILANIALAVAAVLSGGITLLIQAGLRYGLGGRDSLFYKPDAIEVIETISIAAREIPAPAA